MKVVVAHNRYSSAQPSGENAVVDTDIAQLRAAGVEVVPFLRSSDEIADLSAVGKLTLAASPVYAAGAQRDLAALLERERPDVLHLHNPYPLLSPAVVRTAQRHGVPVVQTVHNFRHVCVNGLFFRDGGPCHDCMGRAVPLPGVRHACYRGSRAQSTVMATALVTHRSTWRRVDRFIALTEAIAQFLRDYGIDPDAIAVKPNSIPDPGGHDTPGDGFLYIGRLSAEKGVDLLLSAWRRHPEGRLGTLRIVGDGELRDHVTAAATERGDVEYVGPVPHEEVAGHIRRASVVVNASVCEDVLPTVVIEALANARPVLTTDLGGPPHMIADAGVVTAAEPAAFADGMARIAAASDGLRVAARDRYLAHFSPEVVVARQLEIYRRVRESRQG
ncbi:glycosyltransferase involved in cell wall biosynthesis [Stackebrandtia albiflava]|uniref:Glycosyltransferase involved in cell wall biosynthesis n=1 Tax=Stackebrandtia albiflava TaxID=406432 RepID=A0A562ULI3_9ACTN|nr:glycosyltransferase [Stackebrandtia albiflava]TWJ06475.1 glycosyltransferase involved in cell wall biosynthesis [Stackebrandtia albiflava]